MMRHSALSLAVLAIALACGNPAPPTAPNAVPIDSTAAPTGEPRSAAWQRTGYAVTGTVTFSFANGVGQLVFSPEFAIAQTPGPVVYLNTTTNANTGRPLRIGALKSLSGSQSYTFQLQPGVDYSHVLIWCDPFNVSMAVAPLPARP